MRYLRAPDGARDSIPADFAEKAALGAVLSRLFAQFGYEPLSTPTVEYADVFAAAGARPGDYRAFIEGDGATLALKPDMTPSIARVAASVYDGKRPLRYSYFERLFRPASRFLGVLNEFTQAGVELIGERGAYGDAEVVAMAALALSMSGLRDFRLYISEAGLFGALLCAAGFNDKQSVILKERIIERDFVTFAKIINDSPADKGLKDFLGELPFLRGDAEILSCAGKFVDVSRLSDVFSVLGYYGVADSIMFDLSIVGAWDYYTGVVFKGYGAGSGAAIVSGGRYDGLSARFGADFPAIGFGLRIEELQRALSSQNSIVAAPKIKTFVAFKGGIDANECKVAETAIRLTTALRRGGDAVILSPPIDDESTAIERAKALDCAGLLYFAGASVAIMNLITGELNIKAISSFDLTDFDMESFE